LSRRDGLHRCLISKGFGRSIVLGRLIRALICQTGTTDYGGNDVGIVA
jgi:hypothetical protein